jgi:hypothetical protein
MSEVKVNKISPRSGTNVQLGDSGDTITVPSGATLDASNATTTLPANVVTTTGTQTLTNKTIGSSQLTGALPALDGSALTGIPDTIAPTRHSIRPSLNLDFANSKALDPRITFTRASNATYYDGYTSVKAEENLLSYSQELNNWVALRGSVTANATTAPDGTTTADELSRSGDTTNTVYYQNIQVIGNNDYVFSVYAKTNGKDYVILSETSSKVSGTVASTWFNISTGAVGTTDADHTATITDVGNGWYRCSIKFTAYDNGTSDDYRVETAETDNSRVMVDDGQGIYLWGAQLEQRDSISSYTPTTTAPITKYQPALQTAGNNVARFDHNPTTGESLGLLIEESRTNLQVYSEEFDNAAWNKSATTITANTIIAPDGTLTGDKLVPDTLTSGKSVYDNAISMTSGTTYTGSCYIKKGEYEFAQLSFIAASHDLLSYANFDLTNGTVGSAGSSVTNSSITDVGNGWYRCSITAPADATVSGGGFSILNVPSSTASRVEYMTGDGYSGIYIWGAQVEEGSFPTSYIKTTGSQVTRSKDGVEMIGISDWFNFEQGTLYAEVKQNVERTNYTYFRLDDGGNNNFLNIGTKIQTYDAITIASRFNGGTTVEVFGSTQGNTNNIKAVGTYFNTSLAISANGETATTGTGDPIPTSLDRMEFGEVSNFNSAYFKRLAYYPVALTNNEIQDLSEE